MTSLQYRDDQTAGTLTIAHGDIPIAEYHYAPSTPDGEAPKPFFHPLRALNGTCATAFRPADHRWHKGLAMTWSEISGQNFWGGPTFDKAAPGNGYVWRQNIGRQRHEAFDRLEGDGTEFTVDQRLSWITADAEKWISEQRSIRFFGVDRTRGIWALDLNTAMTNVSGRTLEFGSPTTLGRPDAGYTGLFWRGPRSWTGEPFAAADSESLGDDAMGRATEWLAVGGESDEVDGSATILMYEARADHGAGSRWFARSTPIPALAPSPAFSETFSLAADDTLGLEHRVLIMSDRREYTDLAAIAEDYRR